MEASPGNRSLVKQKSGRRVAGMVRRNRSRRARRSKGSEDSFADQLERSQQGEGSPPGRGGGGRRRKLYDPRRWGNRGHNQRDSTGGGMPPDGYLLVWVGHFKPWQKRFFRAQTPGVLEYYKRSDLKGRSGTINLEGATVVPTPNKDRQFTIAIGNVIYYLRAMSKDCRQHWIDWLDDSIKKFALLKNKTIDLQKSGNPAMGPLCGDSKEWDHTEKELARQEKELAHRMSIKMREMESDRQVFLMQLQALQHTLTSVSGALGIVSHSSSQRVGLLSPSYSLVGKQKMAASMHSAPNLAVSSSASLDAFPQGSSRRSLNRSSSIQSFELPSYVHQSSLLPASDVSGHPSQNGASMIDLRPSGSGYISGMEGCALIGEHASCTTGTAGNNSDKSHIQRDANSGGHGVTCPHGTPSHRRQRSKSLFWWKSDHSSLPNGVVGNLGNDDSHLRCTCMQGGTMGASAGGGGAGGVWPLWREGETASNIPQNSGGSVGIPKVRSEGLFGSSVSHLARFPDSNHDDQCLPFLSDREADSMDMDGLTRTGRRRAEAFLVSHASGPHEHPDVAWGLPHGGGSVLGNGLMPTSPVHGLGSVHEGGDNCSVGCSTPTAGMAHHHQGPGSGSQSDESPSGISPPPAVSSGATMPMVELNGRGVGPNDRRSGLFHGVITLQEAWDRLQGTFEELLRDETQRVIELEAENNDLQNELTALPLLKQELYLKTKRLEEAQSRLAAYEKLPLDGEGIEGDDEGEEEEDEDDNETEDEDLVDAQVVPSDAGDEEYFEALEVLHHHDFLVRSSSAGDPVVLPEQAGVAEPPEEAEGMGEAETETEVEREDLVEPRTRLPAPRPLNRGFSLWSILKNAIGKDLNRITLPATINEPLSVLQRCAEELEYRSLLEAATRQDSPMERLLLVATFACSSYYRSILRDAKPFNPLLGETYEWVSSEGRTRFIAEQVSHHPPIMAFNCEGADGEYCIYGEMELRSKFWGKSVEILPLGVCHLKFPKYKDHYTWNKVTTCVHNVVVGKLWIDNYGEMLITNHTTGETCRLRFHKATSQEQGRVAGKAFDSRGVAMYSIQGNYMDSISATPEALAVKAVASSPNGPTPKSPRLLWKGSNQLENSVQQYSFSPFTIGLNELTPKLAEVLPPTDSRLRPDQRALEDGDLERATPEKLRLEEKQRDARRERRVKGEEWKARWFKQTSPGEPQVRGSADGGQEPFWVYGGEYWLARERRAWKGCPDIM